MPNKVDQKTKNDFDNAFDAAVKQCEPVFKLIQLTDRKNINEENF